MSVHVCLAGGPEREASLRSMVTAMNNMNTILSKRLDARNVEVCVCACVCVR